MDATLICASGTMPFALAVSCQSEIGMMFAGWLNRGKLLFGE